MRTKYFIGMKIHDKIENEYYIQKNILVLVH